MCASNEPDNNRETRQEPNKRSTRRSNFFRIKQPPRQTTRKRETRLTSHSVEIVIDMLPIIIPTYMPTLGRIGGGLVVVSCVARGAQTRAKTPVGGGRGAGRSLRSNISPPTTEAPSPAYGLALLKGSAQRAVANWPIGLHLQSAV